MHTKWGETEKPGCQLIWFKFTFPYCLYVLTTYELPVIWGFLKLFTLKKQVLSWAELWGKMAKINLHLLCLIMVSNITVSQLQLNSKETSTWFYRVERGEERLSTTPLQVMLINDFAPDVKEAMTQRKRMVNGYAWKERCEQRDGGEGQ